MTISVITPTLKRPQEISDLVVNLKMQTLLPHELIIVDGAPPHDIRTEKVVSGFDNLPFILTYVRHKTGTAIQRNAGIEIASGEYLAFVDDDIRLQPDFLAILVEVLRQHPEAGGVSGYKGNMYTDPATVGHVRFYKQFRLLSTYEPGTYDWRNGHPVNLNFQPPFKGFRECDFITFACSLWRRTVFDDGHRFDPYFTGPGVLEDVHLALKIGRDWTLLHCGDAIAEELSSPLGRVHQTELGRRRVVNLHYIFQDIVQPFTWRQRYHFWKLLWIDILRLLVLEAGILIKRRRIRRRRVELIKGHLQGVWQLWRQA